MLPKYIRILNNQLYVSMLKVYYYKYLASTLHKPYRNYDNVSNQKIILEDYRQSNIKHIRSYYSCQSILFIK